MEPSFSAAKWKFAKGRQCKRCLGNKGVVVEDDKKDKDKKKKKKRPRSSSSDSSHHSKGGKRQKNNNKKIQQLEAQVKALKGEGKPEKGKPEKGKKGGKDDLPGGTWKGESWYGDDWKGGDWKGSADWKGKDWKGTTGWKGEPSWKGESWKDESWKGESWKGEPCPWKGESWGKEAWKGDGWKENTWKGEDWKGDQWKGWKGQDWKGGKAKDSYGAWKGGYGMSFPLGLNRKRRRPSNLSNKSSDDDMSILLSDLDEYESMNYEFLRQKKKKQFEKDQQQKIDTKAKQQKKLKLDLTEQQSLYLKKFDDTIPPCDDTDQLHTDKDGKVNLKLVVKNQKDLLKQAVSVSFDAELNLMTKSENKMAVAILAANHFFKDETRLWSDAMLKDAVKSIKWASTPPPGISLKMTEVMTKRKVIFGSLKKVPNFSQSATAGILLKTVLHIFDIIENGTATGPENIPLPQVYDGGLATEHLVLAIITILTFFQKLKAPTTVNCLKSQDSFQTILDLSSRYWKSNNNLFYEKSIPSIIQTGIYLFVTQSRWSLSQQTLEDTLPHFWWSVINASLSEKQYNITVSRKVATMTAAMSEVCLEESARTAPQEKQLSYLRQTKRNTEQTPWAEYAPKESYTPKVNPVNTTKMIEAGPAAPAKGGKSEILTDQVYIPPTQLIQWYPVFFRKVKRKSTN